MINGDRVRQARELLGLTQSELGTKADVSQGAVAQLELSMLDASRETCNALALRTGFSVEFFRDFSGPPEIPAGSILYRCKRSVKSAEKEKAHRFAQAGYELAIRLMSKLKEIPILIPSGLNVDPVAAAAIARSSLGLSPDTPILNLISSLERAGVIVIMLPFTISGLDGFSAWVESGGNGKRRPLIVLGRNDFGYRMRFTVGEEFGHLTLHSPLTVSPKEADTQARRFASELLVPHDALARDIDPPITIAGLVRLKPRWKMSLAGLLRATFNCGMIDANQYRYLNYQLSARGWKKQEPGDEGIRAETPQLLLKMAQVAYGDKADRRIREDFGIPLHIIRCLLHSDPTAASRAVIPMQGGRPY